MKTEVVETTPHSYCIPGDTTTEHKCDFSAGISGKILQDELVDTGIPVKWFPSDTHRSIYDMNREPSRETKYRKDVASYVAGEVATPGRETWVIDVHSFPPEYTGFENHEVALLIFTNQMRNPRNSLLVEYLKVGKIDYGIYEASPLNDIMKTSIAMGAYSILIELNERLTKPRITYIMEIVARWIKEWDPKKYVVV